MKIQIEQPIKGGQTAKEEFNSIVRIALNANNLKYLEGAIETINFIEWTIGFGGSHCWVKQNDINGNVGSDNTLTITE